MLNSLTYNLPPASRVGLGERLRTFQVPEGTSYDEFCADLFELLDDLQAVENTPAGVENSFVMNRIRDHMSHQFPTVLHLVFPRDKATANLPYNSVAFLKEEIKYSLPNRIEAKPAEESIRLPALSPDPKRAK